jgi:long-chain acyl-CoA synthetase
MDIISPDLLVLQCLYRLGNYPHSIILTQPMEGRKIRDHSWDEVADQVRRMAAHRHAALVCRVARHLYR